MWTTHPLWTHLSQNLSLDGYLSRSFSLLFRHSCKDATRCGPKENGGCVASVWSFATRNWKKAPGIPICDLEAPGTLSDHWNHSREEPSWTPQNYDKTEGPLHWSVGPTGKIRNRRDDTESDAGYYSKQKTGAVPTWGGRGPSGHRCSSQMSPGSRSPSTTGGTGTGGAMESGIWTPPSRSTIATAAGPSWCGEASAITRGLPYTTWWATWMASATETASFSPSFCRHSTRLARVRFSSTTTPLLTERASSPTTCSNNRWTRWSDRLFHQT